MSKDVDYRAMPQRNVHPELTVTAASFVGFSYRLETRGLAFDGINQVLVWVFLSFLDEINSSNLAGIAQCSKRCYSCTTSV